mgnify:FL=1
MLGLLFINYKDKNKDMTASLLNQLRETLHPSPTMSSVQQNFMKVKSSSLYLYALSQITFSSLICCIIEPFSSQCHTFYSMRDMFSFILWPCQCSVHALLSTASMLITLLRLELTNRLTECDRLGVGGDLSENIAATDSQKCNVN